jgi:M6 family metalloprotease-like protein
MRLLSEWFEVVSEGKFRVQWVVMDKWVRLPNPSSSYQIDRSSNLGDEPSGVRLWNDAMASADPHFDFTGIQTVNFILPKGQTFLRETSQGFPWDAAVRGLRTNEGSVASFSIPGVFMDQPGAEYWSYWAHEFGHAIGLPHVGLSRGTLPPFNPFDLMGGQDGPTRELSGWLRFFARWIPDERVYCKSSANLKNIEMTLVPLSGSDSGLKFVVVPVSSTKAVLIESRRVTKFSCQQSRANGVLVYTYDATLGHGEDFLKPIAPSGREKSSTNGCRAEPFPDPLLYEADKVTVEGVTIEVLSLGRYDRIRLMRNS